MSYKIIYLDEAEQDVKEAKTWYKKQRNGLQKQFSIEVIKAISLLQNFPTVYAIRYKNIRIAHPDVFPYSIHYYIDENKKRIVIIGIVHNSRDNNFLSNRKL